MILIELFISLSLIGSAVSTTDDKAKDDGYRIAGGELTILGSHPHMVALVRGVRAKALICGGSIIGVRHILTAGHCTEDVKIPGSPFIAIVGTDIWTTGGREYSFRRFVVHPEFQLLDLKNDISIFFTIRDIQFGLHVSPIALNFDWVDTGVTTKVAGWGSQKYGTPLQRCLREVVLDTIDGEHCVRAGALAALMFEVPFFRPVQPSTELCTFHSAGHGTCQGESGGPLLRADDGSQIGIVSWGFPCALGAPDVFTRISAYSYWILKNMAGT